MASVREVDIHELKTLNPKRFEKEHMDFLANGPYPDWWDTIEDEFRREMYELDVTVDEITFEGLDWGHADANWSGQIGLAYLMKHTGLDERYPALYLAVEHDRSWAYVRLTGRNRNRMEVELQEATRYVMPCGIFSELDEDAWEALIDEQITEADLPSVAEKFAQDKADALLDALQSEWDHISSEEYFIESCEINEVKFEIEGETV